MMQKKRIALYCRVASSNQEADYALAQQEQKLREIEDHLSSAITSAKMIELSIEELKQMLDVLY